MDDLASAIGELHLERVVASIDVQEPTPREQLPILLMEQLDEKGRPCMSLPRVNPLDCYWIYNPDGYFRVR